MDDRISALIPKVFSHAGRHPTHHRYGVVLFGMLGFAYLAFIVLLVGAAMSGLVLMLVKTGVGPLPLRLSLPALLLVLLALSALRAPVGPARGLVMTRREAPPLHAVIESLRNRLNARPFRAVLIGTGFGIRVERIPRLGSLLGFHDYLVLGLPLMVALPLPQFRAVLAHELAHLGRARGADGLRLYRLRDRWLQLADALVVSRHPATVLLRRFFRWYAPRFAAFALPQARRHEYDADRQAVIAAGQEETARALVRADVVERFLAERFYPRLLADLRCYGVPPSGLQGRLERALSGIRDDRRFGAWLDAALSHEERTDSHPAVRNRLAALGMRDGWHREHGFDAAFGRELDGRSAARLLLGAASRELMLSIEHAWIDDVMRSWADRHEELLRWDEHRRRLDERTDLSPPEALEHGIATAEIEGAEAALPLLRDLVARRPDMAPARFVLGTLLLRRNEAEGLEHIEAAMSLDPGLAADGCDLACEFLRANGRHDEAVGYRVRFGLAHGPETDRETAGAGIGARGPIPGEPVAGHPRGAKGYEHHGLAYSELLTAKRGIAPLAPVARAFLVRENGAARTLPDGAATVPAGGHPGDGIAAGLRFLLAVELMRGDHDPAAVARRLAADVKLPGPAVVTVLTRRHRRLRRALADVTDSLLFERTRRQVA